MKPIISMLAVLIAFFALSGCVNVHVHFPAVPAGEPGASAEGMKQP